VARARGLHLPSDAHGGRIANFFTINGKAYPDTEPISMRVGERSRIRFIGSNNNFAHPITSTEGTFEIVETDSNPVPRGARFLKDTINVGLASERPDRRP
jgi:FtsP/CotA-like multicopper oxidase with cupredoxin domain